MSNDGKGVIFAKGFLKGTLADGKVVNFAELQDASLEFRDSTKKLFGPDSVFALASEIAEREVTLRAAFAKVRVPALKAIIGGEDSFADDKTTLALTSTSLPGTFKATLGTPSDGSEIQVVLYKVRPINFTLPLASKEYVIPGFECEVMVSEADSNKVADFILPGCQTST